MKDIREVELNAAEATREAQAQQKRTEQEQARRRAAQTLQARQYIRDIFGQLTSEHFDMHGVVIAPLVDVGRAPLPHLRTALLALSAPIGASALIRGVTVKYRDARNFGDVGDRRTNVLLGSQMQALPLGTVRERFDPVFLTRAGYIGAQLPSDRRNLVGSSQALRLDDRYSADTRVVYEWQRGEDYRELPIVEFEHDMHISYPPDPVGLKPLFQGLASQLDLRPQE